MKKSWWNRRKITGNDKYDNILKLIIWFFSGGVITIIYAIWSIFAAGLILFLAVYTILSLFW